MKKIKKIFLWSVLTIAFCALPFKRIMKRNYYYKIYKYGVNFNEVRQKKGIHELPDNFISVKDDYYDNLIVWKNSDPIYNDSTYTHIKKMITVRNTKILLEEDLFKRTNIDSTKYEVLISKYYYQKNKRLFISKSYQYNNIVSIDTIDTPLDANSIRYP